MNMKMTMKEKPYLIVIYGKDGCELCARLKDQVKDMLQDDTLKSDFGMDYQNLSTAEGMAAYALSETVNGQRIPALQIMKYSEDRGCYEKMPDARPESAHPEKGGVFVPVYLQLQTEYGSASPAISAGSIAELISIAREGL